jgi:hypothetical protein
VPSPADVKFFSQVSTSAMPGMTVTLGVGPDFDQIVDLEGGRVV